LKSTTFPDPRRRYWFLHSFVALLSECDCYACMERRDIAKVAPSADEETRDVHRFWSFLSRSPDGVLVRDLGCLVLWPDFVYCLILARRILSDPCSACRAAIVVHVEPSLRLRRKMVNKTGAVIAAAARSL